MAAETQYTANTGMVTISTANTNLDGTGALGTVLTAGANGTLIKQVIIKSQITTGNGMVRLFIYDGTNTWLMQEIEVPAVTKSGQERSFEAIIPCNFSLKSGWILKASTELANTFNVIAIGADWAYYATSVRPESTNYTANTGVNIAFAANSNLDGTGTVATILTAGASGSGWKGCKINRITIKTTVSTAYGMVRLYISDGTTTFLFAEIEVPAITKSATAASFSQIIDFDNFEIKAGYLIRASTQNSENFCITAEGLDWKYPA
jgi:hypothetical protein